MIAREHLAEVERKIREIQALLSEFDSIISQGGCGTIAEYWIIQALSPG